MKGSAKESRAKLFNSNIFRSSLIALLVIFILILAYITGGTPNTYIHLIYIPIILSAYYWGVIGGISVAMVSGILAGILPLNHSEGVMQDYNNWVIRLLILTLVGFITGFIFQKIDELNKKERERDFINPLTGIYNTNKLINNLKKRINDAEEFVIISIKLTNIETVGKYIEQEFAKDILKGLINELLSEYGKDAVYSSGYDEVALVICSSSQYLEKCQHIIKQHSTAFGVKQSRFRVSMKIGIYGYHGAKETPIDVYNKARIAYEQGAEQESGIYNYSKEFEVNRKEILEISGSLLESINNKELYVVYQPMINIANNRISGVEVLTRWNRKGKNPVGPGVFISLAEDIGFIKEISKFVLDNTFYQILDWNNKGMVLNFSINFTANELLENHFAEWERKVTESENIIKAKLEIEITERVLSQKNDKIIERMNELKAKGIKISIDDFGTGASTLFRMAELPFDTIKIDKYFIDHIDSIEIRALVRMIINYAHEFNKEVIAEGVETAEQFNILKELNCDIAQGYYFSKPLLPHEFEKYYLEFYAQRETS